MANEPKMKIGIGADTGDFDKGAKKVKQEMKDLSKVSSDAFGAIGAAIGVDTGKLTQFSSALSGLGRSLQQTGVEGQKAFGNILQSIAPIAGAIAGLGIAGATIAFKALNTEAEAFKNTVAGANMEMATAAYIETYRQVLRDMHSETGKAVAETQSQWKKFWGTIGSIVKEQFYTGAYGTAFLPSSQSSLDELNKNTQKANAIATDAESITNEIYNLERQRKEQAIEIAKINADIADMMSIARDASYSIAERQKAIADIEALLSEKKEKTVTLERQIAELYKQRHDLATDSKDATDAYLAAQQNAFDVERAITVEQNSILRLKNSITKAAAAEAAAAQKEADAIAKIKALRASMANNPSPLAGIAGPALTGQLTGMAPVKLTVSNWDGFFKDVDKGFLEHFPNGVTLGVTFDFEEGLIDITREVESAMSNIANSMGETIGQLVGDLATGGDAWNNFTSTALSAFGDLAISVGKMAIATGLATLGIKAALESLNGYVAIAAGVALVALGTAVKTGLANVASGNYSASQGTVSNTSSSYTNTYKQREVYVNVTGTLVADGDKLVAVLNNTNKKRNITT